MLTRLKELARSKVLNYKYDDQDSFLKIDIIKKILDFFIMRQMDKSEAISYSKLPTIS